MYPDEIQGLLGQWAKLQRPNQLPNSTVQPVSTNVQQKQFNAPKTIFDNAPREQSVINPRTPWTNPQTRYAGMTDEQYMNTKIQELEDLGSVAMDAAAIYSLPSLGRGLLGMLSKGKNFLGNQIGKRTLLSQIKNRPVNNMFVDFTDAGNPSYMNMEKDIAKELISKEGREGINYGVERFTNVPSAQEKLNKLLITPTKYTDRVKTSQPLLDAEPGFDAAAYYTPSQDVIRLNNNPNIWERTISRPSDAIYHETGHQALRTASELSPDELMANFESLSNGRMSKQGLNSYLNSMQSYLNVVPKKNLSQEGIKRLQSIFPEGQTNFTKAAYEKPVREYVENTFGDAVSQAKKDHIVNKKTDAAIDYFKDPEELFTHGLQWKKRSGMPAKQELFTEENYNNLRNMTFDSPAEFTLKTLFNETPKQKFIDYMNNVISGIAPPVGLLGYGMGNKKRRTNNVSR